MLLNYDHKVQNRLILYLYLKYILFTEFRFMTINNIYIYVVTIKFKLFFPFVHFYVGTSLIEMSSAFFKSLKLNLLKMHF